MAVTGPDDDFGDFASAGWTANFSVDRDMSGTTVEKPDLSTNETSEPHIIKEVGNQDVESAVDTYSSHPRQDIENFGDFSGFDGKKKAEMESWHHSPEASRTDPFRSVSAVEGDEWPGGFEAAVQDGGLMTETEFGDFSSGTWNGLVVAEGSQSKEGIDNLVIDTSHFTEQTSGWQQFAREKSSESLSGNEVEGFDVTGPGGGGGGGGGGMEINQSQSMVGGGMFSSDRKGQSEGYKSSDVSFLGSAGQGTGQSFGIENVNIEDTGFGQFSSSSEHVTDRTVNSEPIGALESDLFGQLESSVAGKTETVKAEHDKTPVVGTEERHRETSNMQLNNIPSIEREQNTLSSFPSQLEFPAASTATSTKLNNQPGNLFHSISSTQDDNFAAFTSAPLDKSGNETGTVFGDFSLSSGDGFAAFEVAPSVPSSSVAVTFGQQTDDGFGDFDTVSAAFGDFGNFSSSSSNTTDTFGQFSSTGHDAFGVFTSSPPPQPVAQPQTVQLTVGQTSQQPHISLDSGSVQKMLANTFVVTCNLQSDYKQLDLHLSGQKGADWDLLKKVSDEVKGRFNLKDCETHQHLMDVLHIDVHAVLSPGFGGHPLPFFGNVGWLESELSAAVAGGLAVPVANTLLDLSASPVPPAAPPIAQDVIQVRSVPEITGVAPSNVTADVGMLDLDFFGISPASPASPSSGEMGGGLAMADLQALGLILEPSSRRFDTAPPESKDSLPSSDPLAKVFALAGQSTGMWSAQNFVTGAELSSEAAAVVASLPDLSFIHSTGLMFPMHLSSINQTTGPSDSFFSDLL